MSGAGSPGTIPAGEDPLGDPTGPAGRYAPSPSGDLHVGNLRTAILAWVLARRSARRFVMRMEDLSRVREGAAERQLADLAALGLTWDGPVMWQSDREGLYADVVARLASGGLVYECYCTRREILEAPSAPHAPPGAYPGTCRDLTDHERREGRAKVAALRREPALRLRADVREYAVHDAFAGRTVGDVDDLVLRRGDGAWAYNLVAVVDDAASGVDQVVRGDDLLSSSPRQAYLIDRLATAMPELWPGPPVRSASVEYAHVPLALNTEGARLAKRDGAVTLRDRMELGESAADVVQRIGESLGLLGCRSATDVLERLDPEQMPSGPWIVDPDSWPGVK